MHITFIRSDQSEPFTLDNYPDTPPPASAATSEPPAPGHTEAAAFNRVDLLTTMAGVALLAMLLTPALARTRVPDQGFQCRNNMRQLIHGWRMYAEDNGDNLPNCFDWVSGTLGYSANNTDNTNTSYLVNSLLGPYVKQPAVYKCPADQSLAIEGAAKLQRVRSVSMSQSFCAQNEGHLEDDKPNYYRHYLKSADMVLPAPSNLWVMIDENPDSLNDGAFAVRMDPYGGIWLDGPTPLHDGGCGFAFADGHSDVKKWTDRRTLAIKVTYSSSFTFGISQPSNRDIMWLQDRSSAKKL